MEGVTSCRLGMAEAWWAAPFAWAFARALVTAVPLEPLRRWAGERSRSAGVLVTCVECSSAWFALVPAGVVAGELGVNAGIAAWTGAWGGALLLDAVLERLRAQ